MIIRIGYEEAAIHYSNSFGTAEGRLRKRRYRISIYSDCAGANNCLYLIVKADLAYAVVQRISNKDAAEVAVIDSHRRRSTEECF